MVVTSFPSRVKQVKQQNKENNTKQKDKRYGPIITDQVSDKGVPFSHFI
jgi:hypothetical protein